MKIASFSSNLTTRNLLEVIKYKSIGLKLSQLTEGILQKKNFNVVMEKMEKLPTG